VASFFGCVNEIVFSRSVLLKFTIQKSRDRMGYGDWQQRWGNGG
jgi:hypothetical protein